MASLNKLAIRGIRSFDDKHVQVIEFYSPLTVIVGHNGSGKTTIIECLNYVTSGMLPPGSKTGGAFVHDPKMANEKEVKAQVRLRFWNVNRQRMTATRNLQVTIKKGGGLTMKTLEGILAKTDVGDDNKRNTISTKCSEMDEEVPLLMGVSKAILENVIFCHQEESNWPLSEPSVLKKKFDDIFEATKYTKALDNIKALRKERNIELKLDRERLSHFKADKDKAERMRKQLNEETAKENSKATEAEELKIEVERLKAVNMEYYAQAATFQQQYDREKSLKEQLDMRKENMANMLGDTPQMTETTDELRDRLGNFDTHIKSLKAKKAKQEELKEKENQVLNDLRNRERHLSTARGGLMANRENYQRNLREREAAVKEAAKTHNYAGYDYSPLEEHKVVEFVDKLHELVKRAEADYKRLQADGSRKERAMQGELDRLSGVKTGALATKKSKQEQIAKLNDKIRHSEATFESVSSVDVEIEMLEQKIVEAEDQRTRLQNDIRDAKYDEQMREKTLAIRHKEAEKDKVQAELSALNRQADSRAQLSIKKSEITAKTNQVSASVASHTSKFQELVGGELEAETMEEKIGLTSGKRDRDVQDAESSAAAVNRNLSQLQTSFNIAKRTLKEKSDELSRLEKQLSNGLKEAGKETVDDAIKEAETEIKIIRDEMNSKEQTTSFWQQILDKALTSHKCMACDRDILEKELKTIEAYMTRRVTNSRRGGNAQELKDDEKTWIDELENRRNLEVVLRTIEELKDRVIPPLENQVDEEGAQIEKVQEEVEEAKSKLQRAKIAVRDLSTLKSAASFLTRILGEIKELKVDIARLERDLESSGSLKTVEEVQQEVDALSNDIKNLTRESEAVSKEREFKLSAVRSHSDEISTKTLQLGKKRGEQEKRNREEALLKELRETLTALQAELKDLDAAALSAEAPWREKNEELNRHRVERENEENEASLQVGLYQSSLNELEGKHRACQNYLTEGNDRKIRENETLMDDIQREIDVATDAIRTIESAIRSFEVESSSASTLKNNIEANLRYRSEQKKVEKVQEELDGIDLVQAARMRREFNIKYKGMLEEEQRVQSAWSLASGELVQMTKNREKVEETLKLDYKDIDKKYKEQLIKTKVGEFANNDLEKYGKALDNAILKYHSIKMDEINDTIGHLWNKTYQGTDIDGIRIVSDHDEAGSTGTRKSYNYRVVMIKNDIELDMRGRCSAGQKVLASIIIRLALAESFGQGCGVLALDEPTTNLDQENINALAEALAEIIRERRRQANFQLIVITHDEGFLNRLAAHDVLEYYWRVSRDASQKSVLERQRVGL